MKKRFFPQFFMLSILIASLSACAQSKQIPDPQVSPQTEQQSTDTLLETNDQSGLSTPIATIETEEELIIPAENFSLAVEVTHTGIEGLDYELLEAMGVKYIRFNGILWSEIQPTEDIFFWESMAQEEEFFRRANQVGITVIPIVRGTPVWAQKVYGYYCGAILEEKMESFGFFMGELVSRYQTDEYNIHYWEIWNEPDVHPQVLPNTSQFGCWGDLNDQYYGGEYYARMLSVVTPTIKNSDNSAKILIGGLLLDCDPRLTGSGYCPTEERTIGPKFLEGVLIYGGGDYFDIVSFHGYTSEGDFKTAPWMIEEEFPNWSARGGVIMGKYDYINHILNEYGYEKSVFLTETGYLCKDNNLDCVKDKNTFYDRQAQYSVWLLVRNWMEGIDQSFWYSYNGPGWRDGGILNKEQQPKPVYSSIQILNQRMQGALTAQKLADLPEGLQGYAINFDDHTIWVVVSNDNDPHLLELSDYEYSAYDVFNEKIEIIDGNLEIYYPVYIDFEN
ncbi:MAG: hypothetical protein CVU40_10355 [Chloroflexi bacterium HGW-Chloroflexi-2]|jgi:hypothetical protein|nr:MAG: hypothetical protein CVU40_10355 [Chloroflexi bacterium HGW-Chloroflexi-2]